MKTNMENSYNPKTMCFPPREVSDAALKNYWLKTAGTLPPTDAQIKASAKVTSEVGRRAQVASVKWHLTNGY